MKIRDKILFLGAIFFAIFGYIGAFTGKASAQSNPVPLIDQPLVPDAVVPGSGTFTLTVNGTGFVSGSEVKWTMDGTATSLATTFVSNSQLNAAVPATDVANRGTALIAVSNTAPGGGTSNGVFFSVATSESSLAFSRADYSANASGPAMAGGDLNGDGKLDLVMTGDVGNDIQVLLGNGDGSFQPPVSYATGTQPVWVASGDFNGDGKLDLVVANLQGNNVSVLLGIGDGTFQPHVDYPAGTNPTGVVVADFNGDGKLDLAAVANRDHALSILLGNGDGTFQTYAEYTGQNGANSVTAGDFNRDGKLDAAVGNNSGSVSVFLGNGDGTFRNQTVFPSGADINVLAADLNGDGKLDLAGVDDAGFAHVLIGNGDGTFQSDVAYTVQNNPLALAIADINADGKLDFVVANTCGAQGPGCTNGLGIGSLSLLLGNGDGTFQSQIVYPATDGPMAIAVGDFNGDGRVDIASGNSSSYSVFLQTTVSFAPNSIDFGHQGVGTTSPPQTATFTNNGTSTLNISNISVTGANPGDFNQTNNCGSSLAAGASCTFTATFMPPAFGTRAATIDVTDNAPGSPQPLFLSGFGDAPSVELLPSSLTFGPQIVKTISASGQVELLNNGTQTLTLSSITISGDFAQQNACPSTLAPNANCLINVIFKPKSVGTKTGAITVTDNAAGSPQTASLSGSGTFFQLSTTILKFGNVVVGQTASQTVTVTNMATNSQAVAGIRLGGNLAHEYTQTNNCGSSLGAGASCTVTVTFAPVNVGNAFATLQISGGGANQVVSVSGSGTQ